MSDLKALLRSKLVDRIFKAYTEQESHMILVTDEQTSRILGSCISLTSLIEYGFVALQDINKKRENIDMPALYFLSPKRDIVVKLAKDYEKYNNTDADKDGPLECLYSRAYVMFSSELEGKIILDVLSEEERFLQRVKAIDVVNINFEAYESRVFLLNDKFSLQYLLDRAPNATKRSLDSLSKISMQITSLCLCLNERPNIRFHAASGRAGKYCEVLARILDGDGTETGDLDNQIGKLPHWKPRCNPGTLLILDRESDPVAPLLHEVTYQAALMDADRIKDGNLIEVEEKRKGKPTRTTYVLNEEDKWWREFRHRHVKEVIGKLSQAKEEFLKNNQVAAGQRDVAEWDSKQMLKQVRDYPLYREFTRQYKKHTGILAMTLNGLRPLLKEGLNLEQDMATGMDPKGKKISSRDFFSRLCAICESSDICMLSKLRIVMTYIITQGGMNKKEKDIIFSHLNHNALPAIGKLEELGINTGNRQNAFKRKLDSSHEAEIKNHLNEEAEWAGGQWRYRPRLLDTVKQMIEGKLSTKSHPYIRAPRKETVVERKASGIRSRRIRSTKTKLDDDAEKPRFIIYVLGGVTASEIGAIYSLGKVYNVDLFIGSTGILSPDEYIKSLSQGSIPKNENLHKSRSNMRSTDEEVKL